MAAGRRGLGKYESGLSAFWLICVPVYLAGQHAFNIKLQVESNAGYMVAELWVIQPAFHQRLEYSGSDKVKRTRLTSCVDK